mgnify:CR=1 FL=1
MMIEIMRLSPSLKGRNMMFMRFRSWKSSKECLCSAANRSRLQIRTMMVICKYGKGCIMVSTVHFHMFQINSSVMISIYYS